MGLRCAVGVHGGRVGDRLRDRIPDATGLVRQRLRVRPWWRDDGGIYLWCRACGESVQRGWLLPFYPNVPHCHCGAGAVCDLLPLVGVPSFNDFRPW